MARELYRKCGVKHRMTTPYHPQANGMIEHLNRTTGEMILKMMREENKQKDMGKLFSHNCFCYKNFKICIDKLWANNGYDWEEGKNTHRCDRWNRHWCIQATRHDMWENGYVVQLHNQREISFAHRNMRFYIWRCRSSH